MTSVTPIHYSLELEPDLNRFRFGGRVELTVKATKALEHIHLNLLDMAVWRCAIQSGNKDVACEFTVQPEKEILQVHLPEAMQGDIVLNIEFEGEINNRMAGFYRSQYKFDGQTQFIAVTQFEESDARRAFPCMDHPAQKATFDVTLVVDEDLTAISNGDVQSETRLDNGKKRVTFERTPKMSTYLLFFGVGRFETVQDAQDQRVRLAATPGKSRYGDFGLDFGRKALQYCEDYYQVAYPLTKMDLIAVPDFAFGAMENWGAITFRENLLLHFPGITSKSGEERICEVIAHEIAHQWFGNLVTPSDWKYLWLNESFATYFGYGVVAHYHPEWGVWEQFINVNTDGAFNRDALHETFAIEIPGGEHVVINTSTAPIIYSKGGSILRQIEGFIGSDHFRDGLRYYLDRHQYDNAASHHLWEALELVSKQPVTDLMQNWIEQPGHPLVTVRRDKNRLVFSQQRFTFLPNSSEQVWQIPVNVQLFDVRGKSRQETFLMTDAQTEIALDETVAAYKVNSDQTGFYRVHYTEKENLAALGRMVMDQTLSDKDRWGLQNDLFAMVRAGQSKLDDYLSFLEFYQHETAYLPLSSIAGNLYSAYLVSQTSIRQRVALIGRLILESVLERIGFEPADGEPHYTSILRDQILYPAVLYGSESTRRFAADAFESLKKGGEVHADIQKSILQVGAHMGGQEELDWLCARMEAVDSEHERMNILAALGCFSKKAQIDNALAYSLAHVPDRNKFIPIAATAGNPHAVELMWDWYRAHLDELEGFHPMLYERVIASVVPGGGMFAAEAVKAFCKDYIEKNPQFADVVRLSLERLEINLRFDETV